jgi:hypothetical protein
MVAMTKQLMAMGALQVAQLLVGGVAHSEVGANSLVGRA